MQKILFGTRNSAKLLSMRRRLEGLGVELIGLEDLDTAVPPVLEDGATPLENARQKALCYYRAFHMPVFSCDSGLYFENVGEDVQPGVHIRRVGGRHLSDEEMIVHYSALAEKYGDLEAYYKNAICFVMDETHIYEMMEPSMESRRFIITSKPHGIRVKGFPLDSLSIDKESGKYYYDLPERKRDQVAVEDGFLCFFERCLGLEKKHWQQYKLLLFDLDGTLLNSEKRISERTLLALKACREKGLLLGVCTSRSEHNALPFIEELMPDILVTSGGALIKYRGDYIYKAEFSEEETRHMIDKAREICGADCEITIDTIDAHYWNYKIDPRQQDQSWGDSIYTDYQDFWKRSLKMTVEIFDSDRAACLKEQLGEYDCVRFSDGFWYKFSKKAATKEISISKICDACKIEKEEIIAFGDDHVDIGMLKMCGKGVAMGNAVSEVKLEADLVIGGNDEDGIAEYLEDVMLQ